MENYKEVICNTMEKMSTSEKFNAAVHFVRNLPKKGSFQPSNGMMLKFYSYYKQATEGPCRIPKPGFWDVVNRAKWDAWNRLGNMAKEKAMEKYVDDLIQLMKVTSISENPEDYIHIMGPFIDVIPGMKQQLLKIKRNGDNESDNNNISEKSSDDFINDGLNGQDVNSDSEEFSDTYDDMNEDDYPNGTLNSLKISSNNISGSYNEQVRGGGEKASSTTSKGEIGNMSSAQHKKYDRNLGSFPTSNLREYISQSHSGSGGNERNQLTLTTNTDVGEQLALAVVKLQHTMEEVISRLDSLEVMLQDIQSARIDQATSNHWPLFGLSPRAALIVLVWPFIAQWIAYTLYKRTRH